MQVELFTQTNNTDLLKYLVKKSMQLCVRTTSCFVCLCLGPMRCEGDINVLLVGSGDPRHILKTIAGLQDKQSLHVSHSL